LKAIGISSLTILSETGILRVRAVFVYIEVYVSHTLLYRVFNICFKERRLNPCSF
jgi:hypothetical protein